MPPQTKLPVLDTHNGLQRPSGWLSRLHNARNSPHLQVFWELNLENLPKIAIEFCWNVENQVLISESAETSDWEDAG